MKKALTIYIDEESSLTNYCATFILRKGKDTSVVMQNMLVDDSVNALYLPFVQDQEHEAHLFKEESNEDSHPM